MRFLDGCLLLAAFMLLSVSAAGWDQKGHRVVAAVAWDHMDAEMRTKAVAILRGAPEDSDLPAGDAGSVLSPGARDRENPGAMPGRCPRLGPLSQRLRLRIAELRISS